MKTLIMYHRVDLDGIFSAAIVKSHLRYEEDCELRGWTYGDKVPDVKEISSSYNKLIAVDISFPDNISYLKSLKQDNVEVIWIDHHKTAMIDDDGSIDGVRKIGVAACELTYEYFYKEKAPMMIQYLSAYDVWDHNRFPWEDVMAIQYFMRSEVGLDVDKASLWTNISGRILEYIKAGKAIIKANAERNKGECELYSFEAEVLGFKAICLNTMEFNSTTFESVWDESKYDIMVPFTIRPDLIVRCSFYTTKPEINCGEMARMMGGGGHAKAAGFEMAFNGYRFKRFINDKILE